MTVDQLLRSGPVPLAVRDFGGDGPPVVLLHGGGGSVLDWSQIAPLLAARHRVIGFDLRCHGRSGDGPWTWRDALADVAVVVDEFGVRDAAVVGASLGGHLAVRWARHEPRCPAAVNLDGHGHPSHYDGMSDVDVQAARARLAAVFDAQAEMLAAPMTPDQARTAVERRRALARSHGADEDLAAASAERNLDTRDNGEVYLRPTGSALVELRGLLDAPCRVRPLYEGLRQPVLAVVAGRDLPGQEAFADLTAATRRGVLAELTEIADRQPTLRVVRFDGSHGMMFEQPEAVATMIADFLAETGQVR